MLESEQLSDLVSISIEEPAGTVIYGGKGNCLFDHIRREMGTSTQAMMSR